MQNEQTPTPGQPLSEADVQNGWIVWSGGEKPPCSGVVHLKFRDGECLTSDAALYDWLHSPRRNAPDDIIAYRPHAPSPASSSSVVQGDAGGVERSPGQVAYEGWAQGLPGCEWSNQTATQKRAWEKAAQAVAALRPQPSGETRGLGWLDVKDAPCGSS